MPREVFKQRKEFKKLTDKLKSEQIRFRWEIPCGLGFMYNNKKIWVKTNDQMNKFLRTTAKDQGTEHQNGE